MKVELDGLEKALNEAIQEYGYSVGKIAYEVFDEMAKETPKRLKQETLAQGLKRKKGGKRYANGWRAKLEKGALQVKLVVYNANKPQLTQLLENGHAKVNGGKVDGKPHISPVNDWAQKEALERIKKRLSE